MASEAAVPPAADDAPLFNPLRDLDRRGKIVIGVLVLLANLPLIHYVFRHQLADMPVVLTAPPFHDDFNRQEIGPSYWTTGGDWRIENGELHAPGVKNNPLWLQASINGDVAIDFDVRSTSPEGDIKFEAFGDGLNHASGYVFVFGGWNNQISILARLNEHGVAFDSRDGKGMQGPANMPEQNAVAGRTIAELYRNGTFGKDAEFRLERRDVRVAIGATYHMRIERKGSDLKWYVNGQLFIELDDPMPLQGRKHDRVGPSAWESDLYFDNLNIVAL
jgi:hypothetical protein